MKAEDDDGWGDWMKPRAIEGWLGILNANKKRDLVKHCSETTLYLSDLAVLRLSCEAGLLPGPEIGRKLALAEEWWVDGGFKADKTACLETALRL